MPSIMPATPPTCSGWSATSSGRVIMSGKIAPLPQPVTPPRPSAPARARWPSAVPADHARRPSSARRDQRKRPPTNVTRQRDDRDDVDHDSELPGARVRPAVLDERVRQPGRVAVVDEGRRREERDEQPRHGRRSGNARACRAARPASAADREPPGERRRGREPEDQHQRPPGTAGDRQRHRPAAIAAPIWMPAA